jgi:hypothetical protein
MLAHLGNLKSAFTVKRVVQALNLSLVFDPQPAGQRLGYENDD